MQAKRKIKFLFKISEEDIGLLLKITEQVLMENNSISCYAFLRTQGLCLTYGDIEKVQNFLS